jgi:5-methylcytosine-specific restriction endonuclease McrA
VKYDRDLLKRIYARTDGHCHICWKKLSFVNYSQRGMRGAWEVDHSKPKSMGGTNRINNLYPACISCNRKKKNSSTQSARHKHGLNRAPYSKEKKSEIRLLNTLAGGVSGLILGSFLGQRGVLWGLTIGSILGRNIYSDRY